MDCKVTDQSFFRSSRAGGTFHQMSPEMANLYLKTLKKEEVDYSKDLVSYATDFYSLGILALEMLNGSPPFGYFRKYTD